MSTSPLSGPDDAALGGRLQLRVPGHLEAQVTSIAKRDANSVSATIRRLLALGIRTEIRGEQL